MSRRKTKFCPKTISLCLENGEIRGCTCNRPLPCLLHTPYVPEYPKPVRGPRRATPTETARGHCCRECLSAQEIHDNGRPTMATACLLHGLLVNPRQTCDDFEWPPIYTRETASVRPGLCMQVLIFLSIIFLSAL